MAETLIQAPIFECPPKGLHSPKTQRTKNQRHTKIALILLPVIINMYI